MSELVSIFRPRQVGELVVGMFSADKTWYRAEVLNIEDSTATLCYVDFGNKEKVPFSSIRYAEEVCHTLPVQCIRCVVAGVNADSLPKAAVDLLNGCISSGQMVTGTIRMKEGGEIYLEVLNSEGKSVAELINKQLVSSSQLTASTPPKESKRIMFADVPKLVLPTDGSKMDMTFSDAASLYSFYLRRSDAESQAELDKTMRDVDGYCTKTSSPYEPIVGEIVCARFSADSVWYRARVLNVDKDEFSLQYVDYGTMDNVKCDVIRKMEPALVVPPVQAVHCRVAGMMPELETADMIKIFASAMESPSIKVQAKHVGQEVTDIVIFTADGNLNEKMLGPEADVKGAVAPEPAATKVPMRASAQPAVVKVEQPAVEIPPLAVPLDGSRVKVMVTEFFSLSSFAVQCLNDIQAFAEMSNTMEQYCEGNSQAHTPIVGEHVCAKFSEDGKWYRAKVLELCATDSFKVVFLDYGNFDIASPPSIRKLDPRFAGMPAQSVQCKLSGVMEEGQPEDALARFAGKVSNTPLDMEAVKVKAGVYEAILFDLQGSSINAMFQVTGTELL